MRLSVTKDKEKCMTTQGPLVSKITPTVLTREDHLQTISKTKPTIKLSIKLITTFQALKTVDQTINILSKAKTVKLTLIHKVRKGNINRTKTSSMNFSNKPNISSSNLDNNNTEINSGPTLSMGINRVGSTLIETKMIQGVLNNIGSNNNTEVILMSNMMAGNKGTLEINLIDILNSGILISRAILREL